jgi:hypothetical protein
MFLLFIIVVAFLPFYMLGFILLHKVGQLNANRFALGAVLYLSIVFSTASELFPTASLGQWSCRILSVLSLFPGYLLARWVYKQTILWKQH